MRKKYENFFFPIEVNTFVDMFCGATSISLWIRENYPDARIVLNDLNSELIDLYRTFQTDYDRFEKAYLKRVSKFLPMAKEDKEAAVRNRQANQFVRHNALQPAHP